MKRIMLILGTAVSCCLPGVAADRVYQLVNNPGVNYHWPAGDGWIGTPDDVVSNHVSLMATSGPNTNGTYSYNAFYFGGPFDPWMPSNRNAITFIVGTVSIDPDVARSGGGPLIKNWQVSGTEPYTGHGAYSSSILHVNSGTYNPANHALVENVDFSATLPSGSTSASNFVFTGEAYVVERADFGTPTGHSYVDSVLIPRAVSVGAAGLVYVFGSGTVPASSGGSGGSFPSMPITAVLVGFITPLNLGISPTSGGVNLYWNAEAGKTYTVEAQDSLSASFTVLQTNYSGTNLVDYFISGRTNRFYRIHQP
jgi:hypothetical protein